MRLMILKSPGSGADGLARKTAETGGMTLVELTAETITEWDCLLAQALEQSGSDEDFVLLVELQSSDQATELESILERQDRPLELVIGIDTLSHTASAETRSAYTALCDYFCERGLLRKIRAEGSSAYLVATISRMVEDMRRAREMPNTDPFSVKLHAIADSNSIAPVESRAVAKRANDSEPRPVPAARISKQSADWPGAAASWKQTAEQKGRIRRRPVTGKKGIGGRKPGGGRKP